MILGIVNHFCVDLDICLYHCPAGRSNDDPVLVYWQGLSNSDLKFNAVHDAMYPNKAPLFGYRKNSPTTLWNLHLHHTYIQVIFGIDIIYFTPNPHWMFVAKKQNFSFIWPKNTVPVKVPVAFSELQAFTVGAIIIWFCRFAHLQRMELCIILIIGILRDRISQKNH